MDFRGALDPKAFRGMHPYIGLDSMERGLKAAGRVIARTASGRLPGSLKRLGVRGSRFKRHVPSARVSGRPHLPLYEFGHRVFGPQRGRGRDDELVGGASGLGGRGGRLRRKYADTGKRVKGRRVIERVRGATRSRQDRAIGKTMNDRLRVLEKELRTGNYRSSARVISRLTKQARREGRTLRSR